MVNWDTGNMVKRGHGIYTSNSVHGKASVNSSNMLNRGHIMNSSNVVNGGNRLNSRDIVNRGSSLNSSNAVNRVHRLNSSNTVHRAGSLNHWRNIASIASISQTSIFKVIVSSIIRISLPLGHMNSSSRVSNIATSSSIGSGSHYSRHSS